MKPGLVYSSKIQFTPPYPTKEQLMSGCISVHSMYISHYKGVGLLFVVSCTHVKHMLLFYNVDVHRILEPEVCVDSLLGAYSIDLCMSMTGL